MKRRISIVEDDIALLETLTDRLESDGYLVRAVADGNSGFGQAREGGFDLIVLDLMLPGRDGLNICAELRHRRMTTPILMLTARGDVTDRVLGLRMGADDYQPNRKVSKQWATTQELSPRRPFLGISTHSDPVELLSCREIQRSLPGLTFQTTGWYLRPQCLHGEWPAEQRNRFVRRWCLWERPAGQHHVGD